MPILDTSLSDSVIRLPAKRRLITAFLLLLIFAAGAELLWRGVLRPSPHGDFAAPYLAASRFLHRTDPYAWNNFLQDWYSTGAPRSETIPDLQRGNAYPPTTLTMVSPFALLHWPAAIAVYLWSCTGLYLLMVLLMMQEVGERWTSPRRLAFAAFALGLAPVHTGLHLGNLSILAFLCCGFAVLLMHKNRDVAAGLLLATCLAFKPTVGFTLFFFFLFARRWRLLLASVGLGVCVALVSTAQMLRIDPVWKLDYAYNLQQMFGPSGPSSFMNSADMRYDMLNLQIPLYIIFKHSTVTNIVTYAVVLFLAFLWLFLFLRKQKRLPGWEWASIATLSLLGLLPVYQRNYNGGVVIFAVLWAFQNLRTALGKWILAFSCVFLVSGQAALRAKVGQKLPESFTRGILWHGVILPHANWALLVLVCLMLGAVAASRQLQDTPVGTHDIKV